MSERLWKRKTFLCRNDFSRRINHYKLFCSLHYRDQKQNNPTYSIFCWFKNMFLVYYLTCLLFKLSVDLIYLGSFNFGLQPPRIGGFLYFSEENCKWLYNNRDIKQFEQFIACANCIFGARSKNCFKFNLDASFSWLTMLISSLYFQYIAFKFINSFSYNTERVWYYSS